MLYRPNFCCNCGEKIERVDWHLTVSRRFCDACSVENRRFDYLPRITVAGGALALMFGLGSLWGGTEPGENRSLGIAPTAFKSGVQVQETEKATGVKERAIPTIPSQNEAIVLPPPAEMLSADRKPAEAKFFCGALTRKGTPCSRKVKSRGSRCYQHEGRPEASPIN